MESSEAAEHLMLAISFVLLALGLVAIVGYRAALWLDRRAESKEQAVGKVRN